MRIFDKNGKFNPDGWSKEDIEEFFEDANYYFNQQKSQKPKLSLVVNKIPSK